MFQVLMPNFEVGGPSGTAGGRAGGGQLNMLPASLVEESSKSTMDSASTLGSDSMETDGRIRGLLVMVDNVFIIRAVVMQAVIMGDTTVDTLDTGDVVIIGGLR